MKKIFDWFSSFEKDKILHFTLSMMIGLSAALAAKLFGGNIFDMIFVTFAGGLAVGVAKELYDDVVDETDIIADIIGVFVACVFSLLFYI